MLEPSTSLKTIAQRLEKLLSNTKKCPKIRITRGYLETRLESVDDNWKKYNDLYDEMVADAIPENMEKMEKHFEQTEEIYLELKSLLKDGFFSLSRDSSQESAHENSQTKTSTEKKPRVKLPPIAIPKFAGDYNEWLNFRDLFSSLIHNDETLTNVEKHQYLRCSLAGEAAQLLKHFSVTDANYTMAWKTLESRYNNKRVIVNTVLNRFLSQKKLNNECPRALKQLLDTTKECLHSLENLKIPTTSWDALVVHITVSKLDSESHKLWEQHLGISQETPTLQDLTDYLENRFRSIEMIQTTKENKPKNATSTYTNKTNQQPIKSLHTELQPYCTYCTQNHYLCHCTEFAQMENLKRQDFIKKNGICFNCLIKGHTVAQCKQSTSCKICGRRHHTTLHMSYKKETSTETEKPTENVVVSMSTGMNDGQALIATAHIAVKSKDGNTHILRALIDPGSHASFITETATQLLNLDRTYIDGIVTGLQNTEVGRTKASVNLKLHPSQNRTTSFYLMAYVLKRITAPLPTQDFEKIPCFENLQLADPEYNHRGPIDLLLGTKIHAQLILEGVKRYKSLLAMNTKLGWIISGEITQNGPLPQEVLILHTKIEVDTLLRQFWELEEPHQTPCRPISKDDIQCEEHYKRTHTRLENGQYEVCLPFVNENNPDVGDSRSMAVNRLHQMERKFKHKPDFREQYSKFMKDYEAQGHMELVTANPETETDIKYTPNIEIKTLKVYYLPHHAVLRESSISTKLRVVFDGSAKPVNGNSLNEELLTGPALQQDLRHLFTRWRRHKICLVSDIKQMYRCIRMNKSHADYQRILWRENSSDPIQEYRLMTVSYGTSSAPYLAIRTIQQLAEDEHENYPVEASVIRGSMFMDDLLTGACSDSDAITLQQRLTALLTKGGFPLHKWSSNSESVLQEIPDALKVFPSVVNIKLDESMKALGVLWNPQSDMFELKIDTDSHPSEVITKRLVLSSIAKTFDPLGWLAPVIIVAKILMQKLWLAGLEWDEPLTDDLKNQWFSYLNSVVDMTPIQLPRWLGTCHINKKIELHGFCDASCSAYAAVVYLRVVTETDVQVTLVTAKTKVAPVKQVSIPRLELCGAVLLARILQDVKVSLDVHEVFAWTDSTIVLSWLRKSPNTWKTFVANRTAEILTTTNSSQWHHVRSQDNPADCASRGVKPQDLTDLWWTGPTFLKETIYLKYQNSSIPETDLESKPKITNLLVTNNDSENQEYLRKYSSLLKLIRVTAYCLKFMKLCKMKQQVTQNQIPEIDFQTYLTAAEHKNALNVCIKMSQNQSFEKEINLLKKKSTISKNSKIHTLNPVMDDNGILRVGGRLSNALVPFEMKSPILLASDCHLAQLIVLDAHVRSLHGGLQLTLNIVRQKYWIVGVKNLVKAIVHKCMTCFKYRATPKVPFMGDLPKCRVKPSRPFLTAGTDYGGPYNLKLYPGRCNRTCKAYICLFVCTVTKAIHLELVSDLTTSAFIAAFRRFVARRGHCRDLWSDCGTNFVGASRELELNFKNAKSNFVQEISQLLANDGTTWHFIPPGSPNFGGLWEAGVKSVKNHIKRVVGQTNLTFEEFTTLLTQVEACVNSRPLTLISSCLDDPPLTPGHFLIGEPLIGVPDENIVDIPNRLTRWKIVQRLVQNLWSRWQSEYLTTLQQRFKWNQHLPDVKVGMIVLVKDERLPPGKWLLGKIVEKHPGADGTTRVVTLQYKNHLFKRPVSKLSPLPLDDSP